MFIHFPFLNQHNVGLEFNIRAFEQDFTYLFLTYSFFAAYNSLGQSYPQFEFARANLYIVIFKKISGSYNKVSYSVWIPYVFLLLKVYNKSRQEIIRVNFRVVVTL
jgi:hypothetical protein